jgi:hypothetical protein
LYEVKVAQQQIMIRSAFCSLFAEAFTGTSCGTTVLMVIKDHKRDTIPQLPQEQEIN